MNLAAIRSMFLRNDFLKSGFRNATAVAIRLITGFVLSKIIAVFTGPRGIAMVAQLANLGAIATLTGSGGISSGIVKYIAEDPSDKARNAVLVSTASRFMLYCATVVAGVLIVSSKWVSIRLFGDPDLFSIIIVLALSIPFSSIGTLIISVVNGHREIEDYVRISIAANIASFALAIPLVAFFHVAGAMVASAINTFPVFIFAWLMTRRYDGLHASICRPAIDRGTLRKLLGFTAMSIASAVVMPLGQIIVRNFIIGHFSIAWAGYWQALIKLSDYYLVFLTSSLGVYYIPRLSELSAPQAIRSEILSAAKMTLPILMIAQVTLYFFRMPVLTLLYTSEFTNIATYIPIQLLGDFFKFAGWLISCLMLAKARTLMFITTELVFGLMYIVLAITLSQRLGFKGIFLAYAIEYAFYLVTMAIFLARTMKRKESLA